LRSGVPCLFLAGGDGRPPRFLGNPCGSVPRARDSGGSQRPRLSVVRMRSSARLTASTSATVNDFGAAPSRPASSLPTLHPRQSPGERQGSLPACPLRRWPGWTLTSWIPSRGFGQPMRDVLLSQAWPGAIATILTHMAVVGHELRSALGADHLPHAIARPRVTLPEDLLHVRPGPLPALAREVPGLPMVLGVGFVLLQPERLGEHPLGR
jgi:hypothetical protein